MNLEIPDFLLEMSQQMNFQSSRCTSHPFWQVRCTRYITTEKGYGDVGYELIGEHGVIYKSYSLDDDLSKVMLDNYPEFCKKWQEELEPDQSIEDAITYFDPEEHDLPEGLSIVYVQEIEEVVSTHLTEADANWFIQRKQHDYPTLYTYVESAYWSPQLIKLQDWIKSLPLPLVKL